MKPQETASCSTSEHVKVRSHAAPAGPLALFNPLITVRKNTAKATGFLWYFAGQKAAKTNVPLALASWVKNFLRVGFALC
jgi:hypothetical protein